MNDNSDVRHSEKTEALLDPNLKFEYETSKFNVAFGIIENRRLIAK